MRRESRDFLPSPQNNGSQSGRPESLRQPLEDEMLRALDIDLDERGSGNAVFGDQ